MTESTAKTLPVLEQGIIRAYYCGGAGINLGSHFIDRKSDIGYATILNTFVDTSKSNLIKAGIINSSEVELLPSTDGSGKIRAENATAISDSIKSLLLKHKPEHFNIVVFGAGGGSGSVFGPLIASELLARDETVMVVVVGSEESLLTAENTIKTMKTLNAIVSKNNKSLVMFYAHNCSGKPRVEADHLVYGAITSITLLASRQNAELDSRDVANFLRFDRSTSVPPQLATLDILNNIDDVRDVKDPISIASLYKSEDSPTVDVTPDYVCVGYMPDNIRCETDLHYVVSCHDVNSIASNIQDRLDAMKESTGSRGAKVNLLDGSEKVQDNGLVL